LITSTTVERTTKLTPGRGTTWRAAVVMRKHCSPANIEEAHSARPTGVNPSQGQRVERVDLVRASAEMLRAVMGWADTSQSPLPHLQKRTTSLMNTFTLLDIPMPSSGHTTTVGTSVSPKCSFRSSTLTFSAHDRTWTTVPATGDLMDYSIADRRGRSSWRRSRKAASGSNPRKSFLVYRFPKSCPTTRKYETVGEGPSGCRRVLS